MWEPQTWRADSARTGFIYLLFLIYIANFCLSRGNQTTMTAFLRGWIYEKRTAPLMIFLLKIGRTALSAKVPSYKLSKIRGIIVNTQHKLAISLKYAINPVLTRPPSASRIPNLRPRLGNVRSTFDHPKWEQLIGDRKKMQEKILDKVTARIWRDDLSSTFYCHSNFIIETKTFKRYSIKMCRCRDNRCICL